MGKKARGVGGLIEVMTQGQLGVRTRARTQAIEKIKELITSNSGNDKVRSPSSAKSFAPTQISYLELRSRRLEKPVGKTGVGCNSNKAPSTRKSNSAEECRKLSDLTNSDILAEDSSSWLVISPDEARRTGRQTRYGLCDENRELTHPFYGDNETEEELSLHGCVRSLQQLGRRGRGPQPGVAQSRSNSRSNSVTREFPPPAHEPPPPGILTRNRRKMENQFFESITCMDGVADVDVELDLSCHANACPKSSNPSIYLARNFDRELSFGKKTLDEGWRARNRLTGEGTPISHARDVIMPSFPARLPPEVADHNTEAAPSLELEIENFFLQAELQEHRRFIKQYNFDPVTETPLPGRYDWFSL